MAEIHNPCKFSLLCHQYRNTLIGPFGTVRCSDEEAALVPTNVFVVRTTAECEARDAATDDEADDPAPKKSARRRPAAKAQTGPVETRSNEGGTSWFAGGDLAGVKQTEETEAAAAFGSASGVVAS